MISGCGAIAFFIEVAIAFGTTVIFSLFDCG